MERERERESDQKSTLRATKRTQRYSFFFFLIVNQHAITVSRDLRNNRTRAIEIFERVRIQRHSTRIHRRDLISSKK